MPVFCPLSPTREDCHLHCALLVLLADRDTSECAMRIIAKSLYGMYKFGNTGVKSGSNRSPGS